MPAGYTAAPNFTTLYESENLMETGLLAVMIANGFSNVVGVSQPTNTPAIYTQRQEVLKITPRIELKFEDGAATYHMSQDVSGIFRFDSFKYTFKILNVTDRSENFAAHATMLGMTRNIMGNPKTYLNLQQFFPYTWFAEVRQSNVVPGFHADDDTDMSELTYTGQYFILPSSWPPT